MARSWYLWPMESLSPGLIGMSGELRSELSAHICSLSHAAVTHLHVWCVSECMRSCVQVGKRLEHDVGDEQLKRLGYKHTWT